MKSVNYILGTQNICTKPMQTYNDEVCNFLNDLSSEILKSEIIRKFPDISAVAFWARKANIQKLKKEFNNSQKLGRGLCLHITPSNIAVNSFFSYFFSLLAGNANIVRLPSKDFPQINVLCDILKKVIKNYPQIEKRTAFVKYDKNSNATEEFSKIADCRMIWGGDKTIESIKSLKSKPRCVDITFADRYSICIIDAQKIQTSDENTMKRLSENFYNDTYLMDQNACSSPQLICWLNHNKNASEKFWDYVYKIAKEKYNLQDAICVDKYTKFCEDAINIEIIEHTTKKTNLLYRCELKKLTPEIENLRGKGGYFYEYSLKNYKELYEIINEKYQSITYFGIEPEILKNDIIKNNLTGIDRIIPIGKAMDIGTFWDGHNLVDELSRGIYVQ